MFCTNCGKEISDNAVMCPYCKAEQNGGLKAVTQSGNDNGIKAGHIAVGIISAIIPLVGLVVFLACRKTSPVYSKAGGIGALIGVAVAILGSL